MMDDIKTINHRLAWLAGIIDGEGTIGLGIRKREHTYGSYEHAVWYVFVCNTDPAMLNEVAAIFDILGVRYSYSRRTTPAHCKPQFQVTATQRPSIKTLLAAVMPYLITKRARAELALRAIQHRASPSLRLGGQGGKLVRPTDDPDFMSIIGEMRALNQIGFPKEN